MADEGTTQVTDTQQAATDSAAVPETPTPEQLEYLQNMAVALDDPSLVPKSEEVDASAAADGGQAAAEEGASQQVVTDTPVDINAYFKKEFNWDSADVAKQEIEKLRTAQPANKYENEESRKVHELLMQGKIKEVTEIYRQQEQLESFATAEVTPELASDIIKLGIRVKNPSLTDKEIEFQYKQEYVHPKEPKQKLSEDDEEFQEKMDEWKELCDNIDMKRNIAAKMMQPELAAAKTKIQLPDIDKPEDAAFKDFESYKASLQQDVEFEQKVIIPAIQSLTEDKVKMSFEVNDPKNQMQFGLSIVPDKADFEAAKQDALTFDKFIASINYDKDNKFTPDNLALAILNLKHFAK